MKKKLILHAGQHKTGTSAIQDYLANHFTHSEIEYIHSNFTNSSLWMLQAFKRDLPDRPNYDGLRNKDPQQICAMRTRARNALESLVKESEKAVHVLSAESISLFNTDDLADFLKFVGPFYMKIEVHVYFRPLKSRMESAYQEKLKHRFSPLKDSFRLNYYRSVQVLDKVFGEEHVFVHKYDKKNFPSGSVVEDFLHKLGCHTSVETSEKVNTGLSHEAVKILYNYRNYYPRKDDEDRLIIPILSQLQGRPFRFHSSLFRKSLLTNPTSIERFEKRAGFSLNEDITAFDDYGISSEDDMRLVSDEAISWLKETSTVDLNSDYSTSDIATAVRHLVPQTSTIDDQS